MKIEYVNFQLQELDNRYVDPTNLKIGQCIRARVHQMMNDIIMLEIGKGQFLEARTNVPVNIKNNEVVYFEIKEIDGNKVMMKPITGTKEHIDAGEKNIAGVLEKFNMKPSQENIELVKQFIQHEIPVTKKNIMQMHQLQWHFKTLETLLNSKSIHLNGEELQQDIRDLLKTLLQSEKKHFNKEFNRMHKENTDGPLAMEPKMQRANMNIHDMNVEKLIFLLKNDLKLNANNATNLNNILLKEYGIAKQVEDLTTLLQSNRETMKLGESIEAIFGKLHNMISDKRFEPHGLIKELYIKLEFIKQVVEDMQIKESKEIVGIAASLKDSLDFMSKLNQAQTYLQIPILLNNEHKSIELFIAKDGKNKKKKNSKDMNILIALDTKNMDKVQVLLEIKDKTITCNFHVVTEEVQKSFIQHEAVLKDTLRRLGFSSVTVKYRISNVEENILHMEKTKELGKVNFIDMRV